MTDEAAALPCGSLIGIAWDSLLAQRAYVWLLPAPGLSVWTLRRVAREVRAAHRVVFSFMVEEAPARWAKAIGARPAGRNGSFIYYEVA